jgi:hypothetical protein
VDEGEPVEAVFAAACELLGAIWQQHLFHPAAALMQQQCSRSSNDS